MRKDNTILFLAGLVFGVWVGYFLFQIVQQNSAPRAVSEDRVGAEPAAPADRLVDPQEMSALERMARDNPDDPEVRVKIGTLYMEAGNYQEAVLWFRQAIDRRGEDIHVRSHLAMSLAGLLRTALKEMSSDVSSTQMSPQEKE